MKSLRTIPKTQANRPQNPYLAEQTAGVCLQNTSDYSPFGVSLDGRTMEGEYFRYGYQGSEMDNEVKGQGNSYTTHFRQLDPRIGRWLSIDSKAISMPWQSPYCSMDNNPIIYNDILGDWVKTNFSKKALKNGGQEKIQNMFLTKYGLNVEFVKEGGGYKMQLTADNNIDISEKASQEWAAVLNRETVTKGIGVDTQKEVDFEINFVFNEKDADGWEVDGGFVYEDQSRSTNVGYIDLGDFGENRILDIKNCTDCNVSNLPQNAQESQFGMDKVMEHEMLGHGVKGLPDFVTSPNEQQDGTSKTASGVVNNILKPGQDWIRTQYRTEGQPGGTTTLENNSTGEKVNVKYRKTQEGE
jgi:RHS repeat-associated protein